MTLADPVFTVHLHLEPGHAVVTATGELDTATSPRLMRVLTGVCDGRRDVTLDLSRVTFLDATTADALWRVADTMRAGGNPLAMVPGPPAVQRALRLVAVLRARRDVLRAQRRPVAA